jgi:hypothetical protein
MRFSPQLRLKSGPSDKVITPNGYLITTFSGLSRDGRVDLPNFWGVGGEKRVGMVNAKSGSEVGNKYRQQD